MTEPYFDDSDEEMEYLIRYERRKRIRYERQRRMRRRRMIKRCLYLGIFAVIVVIGVAAAVSGRKQKADNILLTVRNIENVDMTELVGIMKIADAVKADDTEAEIDEPEEETPVYSFASTPDTVSIYSEEVISSNAILVDESKNTIVASKGADERIYPASMTKVLTALVAAEQIAAEDLDDTFTMTLEITDYAYVNDCSSVGFLDEEKIPVRDLFYGTVLHSGGDAAVGLATYAAGSHEAFVGMMNEKLEELGIAGSTHFTNCVGIHDENHYSTVYDMAVIMKAAMENDFCREVLSAHTYTTAPTAQHPDGIPISNWFLRKIEDKDTGGEVVGAKTGYTVQSKNCAVSYATSADGAPYICVTAGSTSNWRCIYDHVEIYNRYVPAK